MKNRKKNRKGFTLVELMVVVVIIGILVAIAIPVYGLITENAEKKACLANQRTIDSAVLMYMADENITDLTTVTEFSVDSLAKYLAAPPKCPNPSGVQTYLIDKATGLCKPCNLDGHNLHGTYEAP